MELTVIINNCWGFWLNLYIYIYMYTHLYTNIIITRHNGDDKPQERKQSLAMEFHSTLNTLKHLMNWAHVVVFGSSVQYSYKWYCHGISSAVCHNTALYWTTTIPYKLEIHTSIFGLGNYVTFLIAVPQTVKNALQIKTRGSPVNVIWTLWVHE
jgi:hypothetical protein